MSEHDEQVDLINWCKGTGMAKYRHLCHNGCFPILSVPNAAKRSYPLMAYLKAEGFRTGTYDLFLHVQNADFGGLWIEMKYGKNKRTDDQIEFGEHVEQTGYRTAVCYSAAEAIAEIEKYLSME